MSTTSAVTMVPRVLIEDILVTAAINYDDDTVQVQCRYEGPAFGVVLADERELRRLVFELGRWSEVILQGQSVYETDLVPVLYRLATTVRVEPTGEALVVYFPGFELEDGVS